MQSPLLLSPTPLLGRRCVSTIARRLLIVSSRSGSNFCSATTTNTSENVGVLRARLLYQSKKRGIRENDILIGGFAEQHLATMDRPELEQYDRIINGQYTEWDLFYYFSGVKKAPAELNENSVFRQMCEHFTTKKPIQS